MADIQSTLSFQDRMSSVLQNISRRLEDASTSADLARNHLQSLEQTQKAYSEAVKTAIKVHGANSAEVTAAMNAYDRANKEYEKGAATLEKYNKQVISAELQMKNAENQLRQYNGTAEQTNNQNKKMSLGFESLQGKIVTLSAAFQLFNQAKAFLQGLNAKVNEYVEYTKVQMQAEDQLAIITKQRMALNDSQVRSLYDLASAYQKVGVVGDEAVITGMAGIAAFTKQKKSIDALTPAMNNLAVKMYGYNVNAQNMEQISKSLGKALQGDVGALSRMGVKITDIQKKRLMQLNEEQRAIELSKMITAVTGNMNEEMAKTPFGQMAQANNRLGDSYERLGAILLPLQAQMTMIWSDIVEKIVNNLDIIAPAVIGALGVISAGFIAMKWQAITAWMAAVAPVAGVIAAIGGVSIALNAMGISFREQVENMLISFNWIITGIKNIGVVFQNVWTLITTSTAVAVDGWKIIFAKYFQFVIGNFELVGKIIDKIFKTDISSAIGNLKNQAKNLENSAKQDAQNKLANMNLKSFQANDFYTNQQKAKNFMNSFKGGALANRNLLGNSAYGGGAYGGNRAGGAGGLSGLDGLTTSTSGGKALKTQNQGKVEFAEDNLELLNDLATQKYAQYFQQLTPNLTIPNMVIHETADVNQVIGAVANAITGSISSSTTGGYSAA